MILDQLAALAAFAFVTSIPPGPNNLMLMSSGARFGAARTVPHMLGVSLGFVLMVALVGAGVARAFSAIPWLSGALQVASVAYLLYLAWRIATAPPPGETKAASRPMTFLGAAAFQWVNPKAWAMALAAISLYAPANARGSVAAVALVFGMVNLPSVAAWVWLGGALRRVLTDPVRVRAFNVANAVLLLGSLYPLLGP